MGHMFIPRETFEEEVNGFKNRYLAGKRYTVYDTPQHRDLAEKVEKWAQSGKVTIVGSAPLDARPIRIGG